MKGVERLSPQKLVFRLRGRKGTSLIIKVETANEEGGSYSGRERELYALARAVLKNTPEAEQLTPNDIAAIDAIPDDMGAAADLKQTIRDIPDQVPGVLFLKVESVGVGVNLQDLWQGGPEHQTQKQNQKLTKILFNQSVMRNLGRMAAFDLLVGNSDRFGTDRQVNPENVDFTRGGSVLPLDNLDPLSRVQPDVWPGEHYLTSGPGLSDYLTGLTDYLFSLAGLGQDHNKFEGSAMAFGAGMVTALGLMREELPRLHEQAQQDGPRGVIAGELARRIGLTFAG